MLACVDIGVVHRIMVGDDRAWREDSRIELSTRVALLRTDFQHVRKVCAALTGVSALWRTYDKSKGQDKATHLKALLPTVKAMDCPAAIVTLMERVVSGLPSFFEAAPAAPAAPVAVE